MDDNPKKVLLIVFLILAVFVSIPLIFAEDVSNSDMNYLNTNDNFESSNCNLDEFINSNSFNNLNNSNNTNNYVYNDDSNLNNSNINNSYVYDDNSNLSLSNSNSFNNKLDNVSLYNTSLSDIIANSNDGDIIYLNPGIYLASGINITKNLTIIGNGNSEDIIIDGNFTNSIFFINSPNLNVKFINLTFIHGIGYEFGGAINIDTGNVYVDHCNFYNNTATKINGGAIYNGGTKENPSYLFVNNSVFKDNYAGHDGGAVTTWRGNTDLYNSYFYNNSAYRDGGAVRVGIFGLTIAKYCVFDSNYAREWGGAFYNWPGVAVISYCNFTNNVAGEFGGALITAAPMNVSYCIIVNNTAGSAGGAIYISEEMPQNPSTTIMNYNVIVDNHANNGSGIYIEDTHSKNMNFDNNYWGDNPNWDNLLQLNNFTKNPNKWLNNNPFANISNNTNPNSNPFANGTGNNNSNNPFNSNSNNESNITINNNNNNNNNNFNNNFNNQIQTNFLNSKVLATAIINSNNLNRNYDSDSNKNYNSSGSNKNTNDLNSASDAGSVANSKQASKGSIYEVNENNTKKIDSINLYYLVAILLACGLIIIGFFIYRKRNNYL